MKVMVVSQYLNLSSGGAERYIHEVCTRLESDYKIFIRYVSSDMCHGTLISRPAISLFSSGFNLKWYWELKYIMRQMEPDIVYIHYTVPGLSDMAFYAARRLEIPCAVMYHSDITGFSLLKRAIGYLHYHLSGRQIIMDCRQLFVGSSTYMKTSPFLSKIKREHIEAPPGIDLPGIVCNYSPSPLSSSYILFVGKPDLKEKGFHILKEAWLRLRSKGVLIDLIVVGETEKHSHGVDPSEPGLRFSGSVKSRDHLFVLYCSAMLTVMPSLTSSESFGMVLAEALAAGSPVVGSNVGGIPELVVDGKNGYLVPPGDVDALEQALVKGVDNNRALRHYITLSEKKFRDKYNWDLTAETVANAFKENILLLTKDRRNL